MKKIKNQVLELLNREDISGSLSLLDEYPPKKLLGPLFSAILHSSRIVRWHAVTAMGHTTARLAHWDLEQGRIVMRRLMWSLNDESGGIGWGAPECMGEIMARHGGLAREYHGILFSYLVERHDGADNYLEYLPLRRGAFWGLARLAQADPALAFRAKDKALSALDRENDTFILACLCRFFQLTSGIPEQLAAKALSRQEQAVDFYWDRKLSSLRLKDICLAP